MKHAKEIISLGNGYITKESNQADYILVVDNGILSFTAKYYLLTSNTAKTTPRDIVFNDITQMVMKATSILLFLFYLIIN